MKIRLIVQNLTHVHKFYPINPFALKQLKVGIRGGGTWIIQGRVMVVLIIPMIHTQVHIMVTVGAMEKEREKEMVKVKGKYQSRSRWFHTIDFSNRFTLYLW